jgi:antagonist of KipI
MIEVISGGLLTTIQDIGRTHLAHLGVSRAGAADQLAIKVGNILVGNSANAAAIEMTIIGGNFRLLAPAWIAITGGRVEPMLDGQPLVMWTTYRIEAGSILNFGEIVTGVRTYLCIRGGIDVPVLLSSSSTFLSGKWGGFEGRSLLGGDLLKFGTLVEMPVSLKRAASTIRNLYRDLNRLRVTLGPQANWFTPVAIQDFFDADFEVTMDADRKGVRIKGPQLELSKNEELVSEGIANGSIQVPHGGQPLILYCEQQTTGGYPKIATVVRADWFKIGQLRPGERIRFELIDFETAWDLNRKQEEMCRDMILPV